MHVVIIIGTGEQYVYYHVMYQIIMHCVFTIIIVLNSNGLLIYISTQLFLYYDCECLSRIITTTYVLKT